LSEACGGGDLVGNREQEIDTADHVQKHVPAAHLRTSVWKCKTAAGL
jgi:hypothetical protein